jgi:hypothetical protein
MEDKMIDNIIKQGEETSKAKAETEEKFWKLEGIEKIRDNLYIRKSMFGYSIVYPFKNDDRTWNKRNTFWFAMKFIGIILLAVFLLLVYKHDINTVKDFYTVGEGVCFNASATPVSNNYYPIINFSNLNLTNIDSNGT